MTQEEPCEHKWKRDEDADENRCEWCGTWQFGGPNNPLRTERREMNYLIQHIGACGNEALWWRPNGAGYTTNVDEAGRFTEKRAKGQERMRDLDRAWREDTVLALSHRSVDVGKLLAVESDSESTP